MNHTSFFALPLMLACLPHTNADGLSQSFETSGDTWKFTSNTIPSEVSKSGDVWAAEHSRAKIKAPQAGERFWSIRDTTGITDPSKECITNHPLEALELTFQSVDLSHYSDVIITFHYIAFQLDPGEDLYYQLDTGSGFAPRVYLLNPQDHNTGTTDGWQTCTIQIPDQETEVSLRLGATQFYEQCGFDNVSITATSLANSDKPQNNP